MVAGSSTLDDVVDKLNILNRNNDSLQQEALNYADELNKHLSKEMPNMSKQQIAATENLIATLESGKLDELEAEKERMLRERADARRDEDRNDTLIDNFKQLKRQFKLLKKSFKQLFDKKGIVGTIMGFVVRSALFGLISGIIVGYLEPWKAAGVAIKNAFINFGKRADKLFGIQKNIIDPIKYQFKLLTFKVREILGLKGQGGFARFVREVKRFGTDLFTIGKALFGNVIKILTALTGLFTGRIGPFAGLFNLNLKPVVVSKPFLFIQDMLKKLTKPFEVVGRLMERAKGSLAVLLNRIGDSLTGASELFKNIGTKLNNLVSSQTAKQIIKVFNQIKAAFFQIGKILGRVLYPLFLLIGGIQGFKAEFGKEADATNNFIRTYIGVIKGAFRLLIGEFLDFLLITIPSFVLGLLGFDNLADKLKSFSFADFFDSIYEKLTVTIINFLNNIRDKIADIGIGGIIRNMGVALLGILMKIAAFPKAVALGAVAALKAAMPGGQSPMEAFSEKFNAVMSGADAAIDAMKIKSDGLDSEGNIIEALSEEGKELQAAREFDASPMGRAINFFKGGDSGGNTTLIADGGFGSRIKGRFAQFTNRFTDDD